MNKITYNERVQALAEKMAPLIYELRFLSPVWDEIDEKGKEWWVDRAMPLARIGVAEMAEEVRNGVIAADPTFHRKGEDGELQLKELLINLGYIPKEGLIPDDGQEAGSHEKI